MHALEGRASHETWATFLEHCEACEECRATLPPQEWVNRGIGDLATQREWIRKYDVIIAALREGT